MVLAMPFCFPEFLQSTVPNFLVDRETNGGVAPVPGDPGCALSNGPNFRRLPRRRAGVPVDKRDGGMLRSAIRSWAAGDRETYNWR